MSRGQLDVTRRQHIVSFVDDMLQCFDVSFGLCIVRRCQHADKHAGDDAEMGEGVHDFRWARWVAEFDGEEAGVDRIVLNKRHLNQLI
jgi:hypothetical protein